MKIKVLLVSKIKSNIDAIRRVIQDDEITVTGETEGGAAALDKVENTSPDMVIMTLGAGDSDVLNLTERIYLNKPRCHVVLLAERLDADLLQSAMKAGCRNVITFPSSPKEFADYLKSVFADETARLNSLNGRQNILWASKVITVFGSKGGLGKTTIASNLAVKLCEYRKKVALIDLDLQFGDVPIFMDIDPKETIAELVQEAGSPDIDTIRSYMTVHSSGVHVLCAPKSPEYAELVSAERIQGLISLLRSYYDYVIVDTPPSFSDVTLTAIEGSTIVLFVTGLDISILKNSKISLSLLESLQQKDKIKVIVNRAVEMDSISLNDVQKITGCPIWVKIPSDYKTAVSSLNRGIPLVTSFPNSKLSQSICQIAEVILSGEYNFDIQQMNQKQQRKFRNMQKKRQKNKL